MARSTDGLTVHSLLSSGGWMAHRDRVQTPADVSVVVDLDSRHGQFLYGFVRRLGLSHEQADHGGTIYAFGDALPGSPTPTPSPSPSPSPLPQAFKLIDTFDATTSGLDDPSGMAVGPDGNIYVANARKDEILVLDREGTIVRRWGKHRSAPGQFNFQRHNGNDNSAAVAVNRQGFVYVADYVNNRIEKFTNSGKFVQQWGSYGQADGQFLGPIDLGVSPDGSVYVIDEVRDDIQKFTGDGKFLARIGQHGTSPGELKNTGGLAVDAAGTVYAADYDNNRIEALDSDGTLLWAQGTFGSGPGEFTQPDDIAVDANGYIYVVEWRTRVQVLDSQRNPVAVWNAPFAGDEIAFIALDGKGHAYVSDFFSNHIYKLLILPEAGGR